MAKLSCYGRSAILNDAQERLFADESCESIVVPLYVTALAYTVKHNIRITYALRGLTLKHFQVACELANRHLVAEGVYDKQVSVSEVLKWRKQSVQLRVAEGWTLQPSQDVIETASQLYPIMCAEGWLELVTSENKRPLLYVFFRRWAGGDFNRWKHIDTVMFT